MDFFSSYLTYRSGTEVPNVFDRWAAIAGISALLEKNIYFQQGASKVYPNIYCILTGESGVKKSEAIKTVKRLLKTAGYTNFSAESSSMQQWLADLTDQSNADLTLDDIISLDGTSDKLTANFICADEMNNFIGRGNMDFLSTLGELWDYDGGVYKKRFKNSASVAIPNPIITMLCGNTQAGIALCFPPEAIGQGFFSRLIFIYSENTKEKVTFMPIPDPQHTSEIIEYLQRIQHLVVGEAVFSPTAMNLVDKIYKTWQPIEDARFKAYSSRRLAQLIKLCMIHAAAKLTTSVTEDIVIQANTVLSAAEFYMPKAIGEFGKARNADVTHKVLSIIDNAEKPLGVRAILKQVSQDVESLVDLAKILSMLQLADKILEVPDIEGRLGGYMPKSKIQRGRMDGLIDASYLTLEERYET